MNRQVSTKLKPVITSSCMLALLSFSTFAQADFETGMVAAKQGDWLTASTEFVRAAEEGDSKAQAALCFMYSGKTPGLLEDDAKAVAWCQKAADKGLPEAEVQLGQHYVFGKGVPKNFSLGMKWIRRAADKGLPEAEFWLGMDYDYGVGVPKNNGLAVKWYRRAAEKGYADAQNSLGVQYRNGEGVPRDYAKMISWYRKAALQGNASGQSNLGESYMIGQGVPRDSVLGHAWRILSAAQDYPYAIYNIAQQTIFWVPLKLAEAGRIAKALKEKIRPQEELVSDLDSLLNAYYACTPLSNSTRILRIKMLAFTLPEGRDWCYQRTRFSKQDDPALYSKVTLEASPNVVLFINLTNLEDKKFSDTKQFLKFALQTKLAKKAGIGCPSGLWLRKPKCKFKYSVEESTERTCLRYTRRLKYRGLHYYHIGHGRLCIYPGARSILLAAEYAAHTGKILRGRWKKEILAEAEEFLNSIEFTAE